MQQHLLDEIPIKVCDCFLWKVGASGLGIIVSRIYRKQMRIQSFQQIRLGSKINSGRILFLRTITFNDLVSGTSLQCISSTTIMFNENFAILDFTVLLIALISLLIINLVAPKGALFLNIIVQS